MHSIIPVILMTLTGGTPPEIQPASRPASSTSAPAGGRLLGGFSGSHRWIATSASDAVPESSGVIAARRSRDIYWTHNDSGAYAPQVHAFRLAEADRKTGVARDMGWVELPGAQLRNWEWEDIAAGPGDHLYLFDGGDNDCVRSDKRIIRFVEPVVDPAGPPVRLKHNWEYIRFEYPDPNNPDRPAGGKTERYDAECLFVHPNGDMYVVTKRDGHGQTIARVFKVLAKSARWMNPPKPGTRAEGDYVHLAQFIADISALVTRDTSPLARVAGMVTGGDIDARGRHVVIRNYVAAYEFTAPESGPFDSIFKTTPRRVSLFGEPQGEGICYRLDGGKLITTSEIGVLRRRRFPVFTTRPPSAELPRD